MDDGGTRSTALSVLVGLVLGACDLCTYKNPVFDFFPLAYPYVGNIAETGILQFRPGFSHLCALPNI